MSAGYIKSVLRSGMGVLTSRVFGLIRDVSIAAVYGATGLTDMFFVAFAIPNLFRQFFAEGAIASAYLPFLSDKTSRNGIDCSNRYLTQLIVVQSVLIAVISIVLIICAPWVIKLFMPGYAADADGVATGAAILRIVMPYLFFVSISGLMAGHLNYHNSYFVGYASTSCLNVMMIIGAAAGYLSHGNIYWLALSVLAGGFLQMMMVYVYSVKKGFRFAGLSPVDPDVLNTYRLLVPSLAGVGISQLNFMVGRILASYLQHGSISWLFYANRLFQFPLGVFSVTISTVSLTELSKARTAGDLQKVDSIIDKAVIGLLIIIIPSSIGLIGLAEEITSLIFSRNAFNMHSTLNTAKALQMYSAGLLFYSFASVFTKVYHSDKNTKTPVKISLAAFFVNVAGCLAFMQPLGHAGIALASSVAAFVNSILLYLGIRGYSFGLRRNSFVLLKILIASYLMLFILIVCKYFDIFVLINIGFCIAVYFGSLRLMNINIKDVLR